MTTPPTADPAEIVAAFNATTPDGTLARYWTGDRTGPGRTGHIDGRAWLLGGHTPVVRLYGVGSCIALTHVEPINDAAPYDTDGAPATHYRTPDNTWRDAGPGDTPGQADHDHGDAQPVDLTADTPATDAAYRQAVAGLSASAARDALVTMYRVRDRLAAELERTRDQLDQARERLDDDAWTRLTADRDDLAATLEIRTTERDEARARTTAVEQDRVRLVRVNTQILAELRQVRAEVMELRAARTQRDEAIRERDEACAELAAERLLSEGRLRRVRDRDAEIVRLTGDRGRYAAEAGTHRAHLARITSLHGRPGAETALAEAIRDARYAVASVPPRRAQDAAPVGAPADTTPPDAGLVEQVYDRLREVWPYAEPEFLHGVATEALAAAGRAAVPAPAAAPCPACEGDPLESWDIGPCEHCGGSGRDRAAAAPAGEPTDAAAQGDDMYERAFWDIQHVLDEAIGGGDEDGAGQGIVADVMLLAQRYTDLKAAVLAPGIGTGWKTRVAEIEASPLRCPHGVDVDEDCRQCAADVMAQIRPVPAADGGTPAPTVSFGAHLIARHGEPMRAAIDEARQRYEAEADTTPAPTEPAAGSTGQTGSPT